MLLYAMVAMHEDEHRQMEQFATEIVTYLQIMMKIFKDNGLEKVETEVGGVFNPNLHNAMFEVPTADMEVGRIAAVMKQGYSLNGRIIRAADVGVAKSLDG
jgi:molecular chaperone GrpE